MWLVCKTLFCYRIKKKKKLLQNTLMLEFNRPLAIETVCVRARTPVCVGVFLGITTWRALGAVTIWCDQCSLPRKTVTSHCITRLGLPYKPPQTGWLRQQEFVFSQFRRPESKVKALPGGLLPRRLCIAVVPSSSLCVCGLISYKDPNIMTSF